MMKIIRIVFVLVISCIIGICLLNFNFEPNSISEIDNRELADFPIPGAEDMDYTEAVDNYVSDRIGFRTEAIDAFTWLNDKLFGEMIHPTYTYGKDGYIFFKMPDEDYDIAWMDAFIEFLVDIQTYCEERDVPFIFWLDPAKITVYSEYLPNGYNYTGAGLSYLIQRLDEAQINYVNTTNLLIEKSKSEQVFNIKYDAGHWNDLGAFYATNTVLEKMQEYFPGIHQNTFEDFNRTTEHVTSLMVSHFPIDEEIPVFQNIQEGNIISLKNDYSALKLNKNYRNIDVLLNTKATEDLPKVLFFQGSYMNGRRKFLESRIKEYDSIHNYENILNFDYYFNIFQPDCVIFETAEYTVNGNYFDYETMQNVDFNPALSRFDLYKENEASDVINILYQENGNITDVCLEGQVAEADYAYLKSGDIIVDLKKGKSEEEYTASFDNTIFETQKTTLILINNSSEIKSVYPVAWVPTEVLD